MRGDCMPRPWPPPAPEPKPWEEPGLTAEERAEACEPIFGRGWPTEIRKLKGAIRAAERSARLAAIRECEGACRANAKECGEFAKRATNRTIFLIWAHRQEQAEADTTALAALAGREG